MNSQKKHVILGLHFGHDASAALIVDDKIIADVSEERFNRVKHSSDLPLKSIAYCLKEASITIRDVNEIAVAGLKVGEKFEQLFGLPDPRPVHKKTILKKTISFLLEILRGRRAEENKKPPTYTRQFFLEKLPKITFVEHHLAHAASAYYTTNDSRKMIVATVDGIGDSKSSCIWLGENGKITPLIKYGGEGSIGWFYSNVTEAIGWWHGDGEGKTMGLAPYGDFNKCRGRLEDFHPKFSKGYLVKPYSFPPFSEFKQLGAVHWHSDDALTMAKLVNQYGKEGIAAEAQRVLEEEVMNFVLPWLEKEKTKILATAGGVFLNVKLNQRIWMSDKLDAHYPYPNPGDSGLAIGAALYASAKQDNERAMKTYTHLYWGPEYSNDEIEDILRRRGIVSRKSENTPKEAAKLLAENKIIGWFQGRMESGPRALGNRSILMSPKESRNKDIINARVKFREAFRPFCPSLIEEARSTYLVKPRKEPYMVTSFDCPREKQQEIPAVVHTDGTLRPQTVSKSINPKYWELINEFGKLTGTPVVLNTSMNIMGEPVVCTPREAIKCFFDSGMDVLFLGDFVIEKPRPPEH